MKKILLVVLCLMFLSSMASADAVFNLNISVFETLGISCTPNELAVICPLGTQVWVAGTQADIEAGLNPGLTLTNVGILPWTATVSFSDPGPYTYVTNSPTVLDEARLSVGFTSLTSFDGTAKLLEDTVYTCPLPETTNNGNGGAGVLPTETVRLAVEYGVASAVSNIGIENPIVVTFGCIQ